jgi:hypothetical protein
MQFQNSARLSSTPPGSRTDLATQSGPDRYSYRTAATYRHEDKHTSCTNMLLLVPQHATQTFLLIAQSQSSSTSAMMELGKMLRVPGIQSCTSSGQWTRALWRAEWDSQCGSDWIGTQGCGRGEHCDGKHNHTISIRWFDGATSPACPRHEPCYCNKQSHAAASHYRDGLFVIPHAQADFCTVDERTLRRFAFANNMVVKQHTPPLPEVISALVGMRARVALLTRDVTASLHAACERGSGIIESKVNMTESTVNMTYIDGARRAVQAWVDGWQTAARAFPNVFSEVTFEEMGYSPKARGTALERVVRFWGAVPMAPYQAIRARYVHRNSSQCQAVFDESARN